MSRHYKNYSDEDIIKYSNEVTSMAQLLKKLGLKVAGGNYDNIRRKLQKLNIKANHWKGQAWSKNQQLKDWSQYSKPNNFKKHLINQRSNKCESCGLKIWLDKEIPLEIHHIDGNKTNNVSENLKLLCCNCHSITDTWRGRKIKKNPYKYKRKIKKNYCKCGKEKTTKSKQCVKCSRISLRKVERPAINLLLKEIKDLGYDGTGRKYGVSGNAIKKWIK